MANNKFYWVYSGTSIEFDNAKLPQVLKNYVKANNFSSPQDKLDEFNPEYPQGKEGKCRLRKISLPVDENGKYIPKKFAANKTIKLELISAHTFSVRKKAGGYNNIPLKALISGSNYLQTYSTFALVRITDKENNIIFAKKGWDFPANPTQKKKEIDQNCNNNPQVSNKGFFSKSPFVPVPWESLGFDSRKSRNLGGSPQEESKNIKRIKVEESDALEKTIEDAFERRLDNAFARSFLN